MNKQKILYTIKLFPLEDIISLIDHTPIVFNIKDIRMTLLDAYEYHFLSCERLLEDLSIIRRYMNGPYYTLKYGERLSLNEKKVYIKHKSVNKYVYYDFYNFFIYSRSLLDVLIRFAKIFIKSKNFPSFNSFSDHKKFYIKQDIIENEYIDYIINKTTWFDELKEIRDNFIIHCKAEHEKSIGLEFKKGAYPKLRIYNRKESKIYMVDVPKIIISIHEFLVFYNNYAKINYDKILLEKFIKKDLIT